MVDLNGEEQGDEGDDAGLIGDVHVSLNEIAEGGRYGVVPINTPCHHTLSTHTLNKPYQHILLLLPFYVLLLSSVSTTSIPSKATRTAGQWGRYRSRCVGDIPSASSGNWVLTPSPAWR